MAKKPSLGRQKIKIAKIEMKTHLQVTFSKRRSGLFKKASELCTLCGVELAIIVFSPAGKVFSFGHPNVESIIDRFLTRNPPPGPFDVQKLLGNSRTLVQADHSNGTACELNLQLTHTLNELEIEKKWGEKLNVMRESNGDQYWWKAPITQLGLHELEQLRDAMEVLKKNVIDQASRLVGDATNCFSLVAANASGVGGFDRYEHKPSQIMVASVASRVQKFGYAQGLF